MVILKNDVVTNLLTYHAHEFVNAEQPILTAAQVEPGSPIIRSHFERVNIDGGNAATLPFIVLKQVDSVFVSGHLSFIHNLSRAISFRKVDRKHGDNAFVPPYVVIWHREIPNHIMRQVLEGRFAETTTIISF